MPSISDLNHKKILLLAQALYDRADPEMRIYALFSEPNTAIRDFPDEHAFVQYFTEACDQGKKTLKFALHYPGSKGSFVISKVDVFSKYSAGPEYRHLIAGTAVLYLTLRMDTDSLLHVAIGPKEEPAAEDDLSDFGKNLLQKETMRLRELFPG